MIGLQNTTIAALYTLEETIAKEVFAGLTYPWEALPKIKDFIISLGETLPEEKYERRDGNIWVARNAKVFPSAYIGGPAIIDEEAEIRHCAFIRGSAIVGKGAVVGNSTELKNVILFNGKGTCGCSLSGRLLSGNFRYGPCAGDGDGVVFSFGGCTVHSDKRCGF